MKWLYEDEVRECLDFKRVEKFESLGDDVYIVNEIGVRFDFENVKLYL